MSDVTYSLKVEYMRIGYSEYAKHRWYWMARKVTKRNGYTDSDIRIDGYTRWRWRAVRKANRSMKNLQSGIDRTTDVADLTKRIKAMEAELGMAS